MKLWGTLWFLLLPSRLDCSWKDRELPGARSRQQSIRVWGTLSDLDPDSVRGHEGPDEGVRLKVSKPHYRVEA